MKNTIEQRNASITWNNLGKQAIFSLLLCLLFVLLVQNAIAQPIVDTVRAIQKQNDRGYRELNSLDPNGESYTFTNVIKWHITDRDLFNEIKDALLKDPVMGLKVKPDEYRIDDIYLFCAPVSSDRVEPFHILVDGQDLPKKKAGNKSGLGIFAAQDEGGNERKIPFQGREVIRLMHRTDPTLMEDINTIQGENVEIPGEIVPHGSQLVKDTRMRYIFSRMFDQFYSKRAVLDEQRSFYGLPTSDEGFDIPKEYTNTDTIQSPIDPESTKALPDDSASAARQRADWRTNRYDKVIDLSINDLNVNASKNFALELELGNKEVGLPFWSSGVGRFWVNLKNQIGNQSNFKLGLVFPLDLGNSDLFTFKARKLSGTFGASIDAYFAGIDFFSGFNLPIAFKFSLMPSGQGSNSSIINDGLETSAPNLKTGQLVDIPAGKTFYREGLIMQLYIPTIVQLDLNNFIQVSIGFGLDNVYQSIIPGSATGGFTDDRGAAKNYIFTSDQADKIQDLARVSNAISPHIEFDYVNHQGSKFGLSALYDHLFTFGGWIELVEDHFRIEMSLSAPIIRDPKPWEPSSFFLITPRFYF